MGIALLFYYFTAVKNNLGKRKMISPFFRTGNCFSISSRMSLSNNTLSPSFNLSKYGFNPVEEYHSKMLLRIWHTDDNISFSIS